MSKKKDVLLRCLINLLAGFLSSFLVMSAFAEVTSVDGTHYSFTVGTKKYENYAYLTYAYYPDYSGPSMFAGSAYLASLSGDCPTSNLGVRTIIYRQNSSGTYTLVSQSEWNYNKNAVSVVNAPHFYEPSISGYYICQGETAVYYNGGYEIRYTYGTPTIRAIVQ